MKNLLRVQLLAFLCFSALGIFAQKSKRVDYTIQLVDPATVPITGELNIHASSFKLYQIDVNALRIGLEGVTYREGAINGFVGEISLPHPDGTLKKYSVKRNQTMHPKLNEKFNEIRTFDAYAMDGSGAFGKWDITPQGLHAMIFIPGQSTVFIDPYIRGNTTYYIVYRKKDFITSKVKDCLLDVPEDVKSKNPSPTQKAMFGTCALRTYRLAVAATGEYTAFHGGTAALAQAAQVTTMNRVNGVYEKDIAITMVIVPNNNLIVYTNTGSDPYTNGNTGNMITQNQTTCDNVIGSANYDIGHVFGTNSGGLAGLGVVCTGGQKARGVTGSGAPVGDPFDIDYVAHEMGHQFGGNHTQNNNCNSVAAARREPGSASTIMGYAGICAPDVQSNSDDYFHGYNLGEISVEILSTGHQCEVITSLNNTAPTIVSTGGNISVPISTPFVLTGNATDPNGDVLTYLWEQMDNEASTQPPVANATGGPNFRSFDPSTNPSRYFPNLQALAANGPFTWEVLPSVSRVMDFRLTVRDNHSVGSCNDYTDITVTTVAAAGPFVLTYPTATGITWASGGTQTVTWNVAGTTAAPISCANVKLVLSIDGGLTYPFVLAASTPNDGTQLINVPSVSSTTCRVMVISSAQTFFDISNNNFTITCTTPVTPAFSTATTYCQNAVVTQLPTTSNNSVTGTWNNQLSTNTTGTTTYVFTPTTGSCASAYNLVVTVNASTTPTFNSISTLCQNSTPPALPTTSTNGVSGTWNSTISTVAPGTNTYTFTPSTGQCATTATIAVTVNAAVTPTFSSVASVCQNATAPTLPTTSNNNISGTWNTPVNTANVGTTSYTFTPSAGQCATSTTLPVTVIAAVTPTFTAIAPVCQNASAPVLPSSSNNGFSGSWNAPVNTSNAGTTSYTFTPSSGQCATNATLPVTVVASVVPTFNAVTPLCQNSVAPTLQTTSTNGVNGTWNATISTSNAGTTTYLFTPNSGQCASSSSMVVTVNPQVTPSFNSIAVLCQNSVPPVLPTTSNNGITGAWNTTINTAAIGTISYTFTPSSGQCATTASMPVTVQNPQTPAFTAFGPYCLNEAVAPWPTTSTNGINGSWNNQVNTSVAGVFSYTFTPNLGECATSTSQSVTVNNSVTPVFAQVGPYCQGDNVPGLSQQSDNGVNGSWSPNFSTGTSGTTTYAFTPNTGSCATGTTMSVTINPSPNSQVTQNGLTLSATQSNASYQWVDCNNSNAPIAGATAQSYTATSVTGSYAVVVTSGGCSSTSVCTVIDQTGIEEMDGSGISLYPNPAEKTLYLEWQGLDLQSIEVHDAFGKLVWVHTKQNFDGTIDVSGFSNGMYFLTCKTNKGNYMRKFLKQEVK